MASRKEYMREWRKVNPNYHRRYLTQRHCKECNEEIFRKDSNTKGLLYHLTKNHFVDYEEFMKG